MSCVLKRIKVHVVFCLQSLPNKLSYNLECRPTHPMATVAILKMSNPECTSTHPKDNYCEVSLQSDHKYIFPKEKKFPHRIL